MRKLSFIISVLLVSGAAAPALFAQSDSFVKIPGGTFIMGSPENEARRGDDENQHKVTVSAFSIGKREVTQKEWQDVMRSNPARNKGDNLPVEYVTWFDAVEYCNKRSVKEGLTPAYTISGEGSDRNVEWNRSAGGYRLPTEAEWEYAAKGGNGSPGGFTYSGGNTADSVAWFNDNSGDKTHPVGTKAANSLGLYDMSGNVSEWCWDRFGYYSGLEETDPEGAPASSSMGTFRVTRGGGYSASAGNVRSAVRSYAKPSNKSRNTGFRVVRSSL
jgi:formylglycine-generating enzyme required for sulfatase activity